jgi:hypothetical protein
MRRSLFSVFLANIERVRRCLEGAAFSRGIPRKEPGWGKASTIEATAFLRFGFLEFHRKSHRRLSDQLKKHRSHSVQLRYNHSNARAPPAQWEGEIGWVRFYVVRLSGDHAVSA